MTTQPAPPLAPAMPNGFDWMDKSPEELEEANQQMALEAHERQLVIAEMVYGAMTNDAGAQFFQWLHDATVDIALFRVSAAIAPPTEMGLSPADWAHYREGQNSVYREIKRLMDFATSTPPPTPIPTNEE